MVIKAGREPLSVTWTVSHSDSGIPHICEILTLSETLIRRTGTESKSQISEGKSSTLYPQHRTTSTHWLSHRFQLSPNSCKFSMMNFLLKALFWFSLMYSIINIVNHSFYSYSKETHAVATANQEKNCVKNTND
jgi:hypothetical protein